MTRFNKFTSKIIFLICLSLTFLSQPLHSQSTFSILSWNVQTFGDVNSKRQTVCRTAYNMVISTSVRVMATQEIANEKGLNIFTSLLPGATRIWNASFEDTLSSQDNGILFRIAQATITSQGFLFRDPKTNLPDRKKATHPVRWAHIRVGDFDFTLLSVHLTYRKGNVRETKRELLNILDWLKDYFKNPKNDPDVIIAGDFNLPSEKGRKLSKRGKEPDWITIESIIQEYEVFSNGKNRLTVLIDEPTSRSKKGPANNYDHFIISQDVFEEFISARRIPIAMVDKVDKKSGDMVSDHYPIEAWFRFSGKGIKADVK